MAHSYLLKLRHDVRLISDGDDLLLASADGSGVRNRSPGPGARALLDGLVQGGKSADTLVEDAMAAEAGTDASRLYFLLATLEGKGFLNYTAAGLHPLATLEPISPSFRYGAVAHLGTLRLSRFACLRRDGGAMVVESPLGHARVVLHDASLCTLPALLAVPRSMDDLAAALPSFAPTQLAAISALLVNARVLFLCDSEGRIAEDTDAALRQWEFHDLLFHARSRAGRDANPLGGT